MSNTKKLIQAAAGAAGGEALNVEDVFSTYLYTGTGANQTITNNIDLSTEGGLVWVRPRISSDHWLWDSARGTQYSLATNNTYTQTDMSTNGTVFNTDGFTDRMQWGSGTDVVSWTFRKAPKFFDVVTYTGTGSAQNISHNLGTVPGCIIIKNTSSIADWTVYHRGVDSTSPEDYNLALNKTDARDDNVAYFNDTAPTSTVFTVNSDSTTNTNGDTYVAYLFAHNDGDGEFGSTADQDIIKCGSYTGTGAAGNEIDLGFEPQWLLVKNANDISNWNIYDMMRGITVGGTDYQLEPNTSDAELGYLNWFDLTPTGFKVQTTATAVNGSGNSIIYIAIRRGPMAVPTDATDVFDISHAVNTIDTSWPVDLAITTQMSGDSNYVRDRLRGSTTANRTPYLKTDATSAEADGGIFGFDDMTGLGISGWGTGYVHWLWRRAPNYFDVVAYTGTGTTLTVNHNLGVVPEMMWIKNRSSAQNWAVYHTMDSSGFKLQFLNNTDSQYSYSYPSSLVSQPTATSFQVGGFGTVGDSGNNYIAYLFASVAGVSKVGSVTHTFNTTTNVDCGFSSGARFVLIKSSSDIGPWRIWDSTRGIVAGNDPYLHLNDTQAEITNGDLIDPYSSGFALSPNFYSETYIFYAIA